MAGKATKKAKQRKWIITDWFTEEDGDWKQGLARWQSLDESTIRYAVYVVETGKDGKAHMQAFIHFTRPLALTTIKSRLKSKSIHCETVINDEAAVHYCSKPHDGCSCKHCSKTGERLYGPVEIGKMPNYEKKSSETPTELLIAMIESGKTDEEIAKEAAWALLRHCRGIASLRFALMRESSRKWREVEVILLTGEAGTGKTAFAISDSADGYFKPDLSKKEIWFDGYQGERTLILDDFRGTSCKFEQLLKLLDGHQLSIPIKGGHTYALWTRVYITSNTTPEEWYHRLTDSEYFSEIDAAKERLAFWRRITLNVSDIHTQHTYPDCLDYVASCIDKERKTSSKVLSALGEQNEGEDEHLSHANW